MTIDDEIMSFVAESKEFDNPRTQLSYLFGGIGGLLYREIGLDRFLLLTEDTQKLALLCEVNKENTDVSDS